MSRPRSRWARTACISAATTRGRTARARRACCSACPRRMSARRLPAPSRVPTTSEPAPSGRGARIPTPARGSGSTVSPRVSGGCAGQCAGRTSRSAASTPRMRRTASSRAQKALPSSAPSPTRPPFARLSMPRLADVGELGLLAELERRGLVHGIENDTAEIAGAVVTQDALVEGVHFRLDWITPRDLGFRAAAVNLSDLAAAGARPDGLIVTPGARGDTSLADVLALYEGISEAGVPVVGGDTTRADLVVLRVTAIGRSERVPGRGGARPGDLLVLTGPLGAAGAAFRRGTYVRPPLRLKEGQRLARHAHAVLDVSDGIARDAGRLATRSGCRVVVDLDRVPL